MPYEIIWMVEKRVIYERIYGEMQRSEVAETSTEIERLIAEGDSPVHLIADMREVTSFPNNLKDIRSDTSFLKMMRNSDLGYVCFLTNNVMLSFIAGLMSQLLRFRFKKVSTLEDAQNALMNADNTLEGLFKGAGES